MATELQNPPNRIQALREEVGWSLRRLAKEAGVDHSHLARMEKGENNLSLAWMRRIARALDRSVVDLLQPEDLKPPSPKRAGRHAKNEPFTLLQTPPVRDRTWPIEIVDDSDLYSPRGCIHFGEKFLEFYSANPMQLRVFVTNDTSMEPRLPVRSVCVVDLAKTKLLDGALYAVEYESQVLVRKAVAKGADWQFQAEVKGNPVFALSDVKVIGFVLWGGWAGPRAEMWIATEVENPPDGAPMKAAAG